MISFVNPSSFAILGNGNLLFLKNPARDGALHSVPDSGPYGTTGKVPESFHIWGQIARFVCANDICFYMRRGRELCPVQILSVSALILPTSGIYYSPQRKRQSSLEIKHP